MIKEKRNASSINMKAFLKCICIILFWVNAPESKLLELCPLAVMSK